MLLFFQIIILAIQAFVLLWTVIETRKIREQQVLPLTSIRVGRGIPFTNFNLENIGVGAALKVKFGFVRDLLDVHCPLLIENEKDILKPGDSYQLGFTAPINDWIIKNKITRLQVRYEDIYANKYLSLIDLEDDGGGIYAFHI